MIQDWSDVLLDLVNTTPVVDGVDTDLLADDAAALTWLLAHRGNGEDVVDVRAVRAVRADLQRVIRGHANADVLNRYVAAARRVPSIGSDGVEWSLESADWPARVALAWGELQRQRPGRLRACANDECHLFLLDRSRGGTGRWCSMSECGNRMKARRHYGRTAGRPVNESP